MIIHIVLIIINSIKQYLEEKEFVELNTCFFSINNFIY